MGIGSYRMMVVDFIYEVVIAKLTMYRVRLDPNLTTKPME